MGLKEGDRVCFHSDPRTKGTVESFTSDGLKVLVRWDNQFDGIYRIEQVRLIDGPPPEEDKRPTIPVPPPAPEPAADDRPCPRCYYGLFEPHKPGCKSEVERREKLEHGVYG